MEVAQGCVGCGANAPPYTPCELCDGPGFCIQCVMQRDGVLMCAPCTEQQHDLYLQAAPLMALLAEPDPKKPRVEEEEGPHCSVNRELCGKNKDNVAQCRDCGSWFCRSCEYDPDAHPCRACQGLRCKNANPYWKRRRWTLTCCGKRLCEHCQADHVSHDPEHLAYRCNGCHNLVRRYGDFTMACLVPGCPRVNGCLSVQCGSHPDLREYGGLYCFDHISKTPCPGCLRRYPLHRHGAVRLRALHGGRIQATEQCGLCMSNVRAFVETLLMLGNRGALPRLPTVVMDMLLYWTMR